MNTRFLPAKLFLGAGILSALFGVIVMPRGLEIANYFNPLFLLFMPRLVPFAVAVLCSAFGLIYFVLDCNFKRTPNLPLSLAHLCLFLAGVYGHVAMLRTMGRVLNGAHIGGIPRIEIDSEGMLMMALGLSFAVFIVNIIWSFRNSPRHA